MGWLADILQEIPVSAALKAKLEKLEAEYNDLKSELEQTKKENASLKAELGKFQQQGHLSKEEVEIIKVLAQHGGRLTLAEIASHLNVHQTRAEHFLNKLWEDEYVGFADSYINPRTYGLYPKGQEYAVTHGFV